MAPLRKEPYFIDIKQAATILGVSTHFMYRLIGGDTRTKTRPRVVAFGRRWKFPYDEFMEWARNQTVDPVTYMKEKTRCSPSQSPLDVPSPSSGR